MALPGTRVPDAWFVESGHPLMPGYSVRQDLRFSYVVYEQEIIIRLSVRCSFCHIMAAMATHMQIRLAQQAEVLALLMNRTIRFQETEDGAAHGA
jgi:hypothetical protein